MVTDIYFIVKTPAGVHVRTTRAYWKNVILVKHPSVRKFEEKIKETLQDPDQVRRSKIDTKVYLYYKSVGKLSACVVVEHLNEDEGYIVTAYITDRIKEGDKVYEKNKN